MRKIIILTVIVILATIGVVFLFQVDYQKIKTSKNIYSVGEKVSYSLTDFRLYRCDGDQIEFYRQINNQWELIPVVPGAGFELCLDGEQMFLVDSPLCCRECKFFDKPFLKETRDREIKLFEKIADGPCKSFSTKQNEELFKGKSFPSYISKPASAGFYKIKFGKSETTFEIK